MYLILIIVGTVVFDQLIKYLVSATMLLNETIPIIKNFFYITYIHNDGAAFGIMAGKSIFLIGLPAVMMVAGIIILVIFRNRFDRLVLISIALITGGGIGNLIDRSIYGYVIDFIDFKIWNPIFNIADIAVCIGCGLLILYMLVIDGKKMENPIKIIIKDDMEGSRIDAALADSIQNLSRSAIQKLIEKGSVSLNGNVCREKKRKVSEGDSIDVMMPEPEELDVAAENIPLDIVYEDDDVLVVNKPKGMVVHPAAGNYTGTLVNAIMYHCKGRLSSINGVIRPGIVHRIDKDTSGLLMIAKTDEAHRSLAMQLEKHTIKRSYQAIVYNNFTEDEGFVDAPIGRDPSNRLRQAVTEQNSKPAYTTYRVLERFGRFTLIEAVLRTGRTHQIRVHMAYIKHPLLGDTVYGPKKPLYGAQGQMLHAKTLGFIHPSTGEYMEFDSELPQEFQLILEKLRRNI